MSIEKMMCLSTGHIEQSTAEALETISSLAPPPKWVQRLIIYPHGEYGWLMCIGGDVVDHVDLIQDEIPEELFACMKHAHAHDCEWLLLDQDADLIDELPDFDW